MINFNFYILHNTVYYILVKFIDSRKFLIFDTFIKCLFIFRKGLALYQRLVITLNRILVQWMCLLIPRSPILSLIWFLVWMNILLELMPIHNIWLLNRVLSRIIVYNLGSHSWLLNNLAIIVFFRRNTVNWLPLNRHHLILNHLVATLNHIILWWIMHIWI